MGSFLLDTESITALVENVVVLSKIGASTTDGANDFYSHLNAIPKASGIICLYGILVDEDGKYCKDKFLVCFPEGLVFRNPLISPNNV